MDRFAHSAANLLLGNDRGAAALECTLVGPHFVAERPCTVAITGADLDPRVNGAQAPMWASLRSRMAGRRSKSDFARGCKNWN